MYKHVIASCGRPVTLRLTAYVCNAAITQRRPARPNTRSATPAGFPPCALDPHNNEIYGNAAGTRSRTSAIPVLIGDFTTFFKDTLGQFVIVKIIPGRLL